MKKACPAKPWRSGGFTLVEIIVVLGVFSILVLAGTDFVIQMIRANNQTIIQNEVRQNGSIVMQELTNSIRDAACVNHILNGNNLALLIYSDKGCSTLVDRYDFNVSENGRIYRGLVVGSQARIISDTVAACGDTCGLSSTCSSNGFSLYSGADGTGSPVSISLTLEQKPQVGLRSDFCGQITLTNTLTPRQY